MQPAPRCCRAGRRHLELFVDHHFVILGSGYAAGPRDADVSTWTHDATRVRGTDARALERATPLHVLVVACYMV